MDIPKIKKFLSVSVKFLIDLSFSLRIPEISAVIIIMRERNKDINISIKKETPQSPSPLTSL